MSLTDTPTLTEALDAFHHAATAASSQPGTDVPAELAAVAACRQLLARVEVEQAAAVALARRAGATWFELAAALGVSKQAVQQRYGKTLPDVRAVS